jgi:hypothetical protein
MYKTTKAMAAGAILGEGWKRRERADALYTRMGWARDNAKAM